MIRSQLVLVCRTCLVSALALSSSTGCWYDSTWGARKTAQLHNAALATPATLAAPSEASGGGEGASDRSRDPTALRVRVHAAPGYVAQTPDWKAHVASILAQASPLLQASVGAGLVLEDATAWDHPSTARLDIDLAALREEDAGDGADLVIGLVGGLPITTKDFEQVGLSQIHGKHLVVRAPDVAREYDSLEKAFTELSVEQRTRLRRERVRHREVAVLLHEIGHSLGAQHATSAGSLMRPAYDPKMTSFDEAAIAEMRRGLALRAGDAGAPHETQSAVAAKTEPTASTAAAAAPVEVQPNAKEDAPRALDASDRALWQKAREAASGGDANAAWEIAKPLFARYPRSYAVQDLRCKLAMAHLGSYADAREECDVLMKLTLAGAKPD